MTNAEIKARLQLLKNLIKLNKTIASDIMNAVITQNDKTTSTKITPHQSIIHNTMHEYAYMRSLDDIEKIMTHVNKIDYIEKSDVNINVPEIEIDKYLNAIINLKTDGGKLTAYNSTPDNQTMQDALDYITDEGNQIQLAMAEVKKGELADTPDNKNIDVYSYNDIYSDDYTDKFTINYNDIDDAF